MAKSSWKPENIAKNKYKTSGMYLEGMLTGINIICLGASGVFMQSIVTSAKVGTQNPEQVYK